MPLNTVNTTQQAASTGFSGELYFVIVIFSIISIATLLIIYLIIKIWGSPILKSADARISGDAIIQHFQNSSVGSLLIAPLLCGAIRHRKVSDGTLISIPHGINELEGISFVNSWNLAGITIPTFLIGGVSKLRELGIKTRAQLEYLTSPQVDASDPQKTHPPALDKHQNLITESYNFNDFKDILDKSRNPNHINLQIEHVSDFIRSVNPHYTESLITKYVRLKTFKIKDNFAGTLIVTAIGIFIVGLIIYILMGAV